MANKSKSSLNLRFLIFIILALIVGVIIGKYFFSTTKPLVTSQVTETWDTYTHEQLENFENIFDGFIIHYPSSWNLSINKKINNLDPQESQMLFLILEKGKSRIEITQAPMGGGGCLFPEHVDQEGPFARYYEYETLRTTNGIEWRRALFTLHQENNETVYVICTGNDELPAFNSSTPIGNIIYYVSPDERHIISEFDEIIEKIELFN